MAYGHEIESNTDEYIKLASFTITSVLSLGVQGLNPIDNLPFCKYRIVDSSNIANAMCLSVRFLPSWIPGGSLPNKARSARKMVNRMVNEPYDRVNNRRVRNALSFISYFLEVLS